MSMPQQPLVKPHSRQIQQQQSPQLLNLPNEVLTSIVHLLDNPPPSSVKSLSKPEYSLTFSTVQPLKTLSRINKHFRSLSLPILFQHARLDPYYLSAFLSFTVHYDLTRYITTITAQLQGPCNHIHPSWWATLISHLPNVRTLTVLAAPHVFAEIGQIPIDTSHSWAFKFPYHSMTLSLTPQIRFVSTANFERLSLHSQEDAASNFYTEATTRLQQTPNLLTAKPWTHLTFNESSHLPVYSTYEYFLKTPPSLITASIQHRGNDTVAIQASLASRPIQSLNPITNFAANLESFSYIAIFPFYNHVGDVLKCVRQMKKLKRLFVKLCPEPDSTELQDELERNSAGAGRTEGRIDVNDPWNEFETSYTLIPHTVIYLTTDGSLEFFQTDDVKMSGIRDTLIEDINLRLMGVGCWSHKGEGVWIRDGELKTLSA